MSIHGGVSSREEAWQVSRGAQNSPYQKRRTNFLSLYTYMYIYMYIYIHIFFNVWIYFDVPKVLF